MEGINDAIQSTVVIISSTHKSRHKKNITTADNIVVNPIQRANIGYISILRTHYAIYGQ